MYLTLRVPLLQEITAAYRKTSTIYQSSPRVQANLHFYSFLSCNMQANKKSHNNNSIYTICMGTLYFPWKIVQKDLHHPYLNSGNQPSFQNMLVNIPRS